MTEKKSTNKKFGTKKPTPKRPEIGASGTTNFQGIIDTDEYVTELTGTTLYKTVDKMRWSDASVQASLLMCELPIRSAEWNVEPASQEAQDVEVAEFIKECLFNELLVSWEQILRQVLLMHPYGCMPFEIIYKIRDDGKVCWRKWAPRLPRTIERWNVDKNGELESLIQRVYKDNKYEEIEIPVQKLMVFVYRQEGDNYLGSSLLRQAYKHWFFREKYYKVDAVAQERTGIGIPVITLPDGYTDDDYDNAEKLGKNLRGHEKACVVKKTGWEVEMLDMKNSSLRDPMPMLEHHTREILKAVLAQFIEIGATSSKGGYSQSESDKNMFLSSLDASAKLVEQVVNKEIIKLVDYNFNVDKYPKLSHTDLAVRDVKELAEAIQGLVFSGVLIPDEKLEVYLRDVLKLPERDEESERAKDEEPKETPEGEPEKEEKKEKEFTSTKWHRPLTIWEKRVKFDEMRNFMDEAQKKLLQNMRAIITMEKARLLPKFESAIRRNDYSALHRISWELKGQYSAMFKEDIKKIFEHGKLKASYEIKKPAPGTTDEINKRINQRSTFLANRHEKDMLVNIKEIAAVAMMNPEVTNIAALSEVEKGIEKFINKNARATSALVASSEINNGRVFTFESFKDDLYGYQWSAILDGATCNYCKSMDGKTIGVEDKAFSEYKPGEVHFACRCIWVGITKEEINPPPFTGIPNQLRPQTQMPTWDFKDLEHPLPGSGKRKMPYGVGVHKETK